MDSSASTTEYQALAQFRFLIRRYLVKSENAARSVGLEPQQYMALLALRGLPAHQEATIRTLAEQLMIRHHSAVQLVNRIQKRGLCRRKRSKRDRRHVIVHITRRGEKLLNRLVRHRIADLRVSAPELARALRTVLPERSHPVRANGKEGIENETSKRRKKVPISISLIGAAPDSKEKENPT